MTVLRAPQTVVQALHLQGNFHSGYNVGSFQQNVKQQHGIDFVPA